MAENKKLPEAEIEKETMLSCMIERQKTTPSDKNMESMFNALKESSVYIPTKIVLSKEDQMKVAEAVKNKRPMPKFQNMRLAPQLLANNNGDKIMPWFSREAEYSSQKHDGITFLRLPAVKAAEMADNMPDAFDIVLDLYTHPVKLTLDEMLAGLNGEALPEDEGETE
ncbi:MAG: SseB family protein [Lachnospiraceae bacterium]